ncbi:hypothetical protein G3I60_33695 [Streptomyces sp. SID13666]|uniref:hypothetical protein n=1 Tax=unclassified Streptomyces TaxID=2593676 RepID=UPI0013C02BA9|nr:MULTISPECIES: hypothetical protein [unclassified Streptomyces]NEA58980.1 hypothetical protein [Streptomyces sp. SID13666]NEA75284.1 hypothetical protein [Streptomyces sp. SID13588]
MQGTETLLDFLRANRDAGRSTHIWATKYTKAGNVKADRVTLALDHWKKHQAEFPELKQPGDYVAKAHSYRKLTDPGSPPPGYRVFDRKLPNGTDVGWMVYETKSNTLITYNAEGLPVTMYRPSKYDPATNPNGYKEATLEDHLQKNAGGAERH